MRERIYFMRFILSMFFILVCPCLADEVDVELVACALDNAVHVVVGEVEELGDGFCNALVLLCNLIFYLEIIVIVMGLLLVVDSEGGGGSKDILIACGRKICGLCR